MDADYAKYTTARKALADEAELALAQHMREQTDRLKLITRGLPETPPSDWREFGLAILAYAQGPDETADTLLIQSNAPIETVRSMIHDREQMLMCLQVLIRGETDDAA